MLICLILMLAGTSEGINDCTTNVFNIHDTEKSLGLQGEMRNITGKE